MWRCKWIELQIRELQSQALKYDGELAAYDERKQFEFERFTLEDFDAKSLPFSSQIPRNKVMKRKKRKRVESTIDIASYMSQHNLFSYYGMKFSIFLFMIIFLNVPSRSLIYLSIFQKIRGLLPTGLLWKIIVVILVRNTNVDSSKFDDFIAC